MNTEAERAEFEAKFPLKEGIYWDVVVSQYEASDGNDHEAELQHARWQAWQSARAQQAEAEPVAWLNPSNNDVCTLTQKERGQFHGLPGHRGDRSSFYYTVPLYRPPAPPTAPVVPDDDKLMEWAQGWREWDYPEGLTTEDRIIYGVCRSIRAGLAEQGHPLRKYSDVVEELLGLASNMLHGSARVTVMKAAQEITRLRRTREDR